MASSSMLNRIQKKIGTGLLDNQVPRDNWKPWHPFFKFMIVEVHNYILAHGPWLKLIFCCFDLSNFPRYIFGQVNESMSVTEREVVAV